MMISAKNIFCAFTLLMAAPAYANVVGTHMQNFNPTTSGLDYVTVHSAKTLASGQFNLSLYFDYAKDSLPFSKAPLIPHSNNYPEPHDSITSSHLGIGFGLMENWDIGISAPIVLGQDIDSSTQLNGYDDTGVTEFRINSKYRAWSQDNMGFAVVGSANFDRTNNNPFTGSDAGATWNLEGVFDYQINPQMLWAFNLGYRFADDGGTIPDTGVLPLGDQLIYSTAIAYQHFPWDTTFIGELFGSDYMEDAAIPVDRKFSNLEILAAARKNVWEKLNITGGFSIGLFNGIATPDLRLFVGANWLLGPVQPLGAAEPVMVATPVVETTYEEVPSETIVLNSINFDTDKARMTAASRASMNAPLAQIGKNLETIRVIIVEGHTDNRGTDAYNQTLSEKRAKAVREVLLKELSLQENQVQAQGFGEKRPVDTADTDAARTKNRRVELKIYRTK